MKDYLEHDPWNVIESGFHPLFNRVSESVFSLGNGHMGLRGCFEEGYGGDSLQGSYMAGVYYPDKTRVGWWKVGYPEYFAKVINSTNWIGIDAAVDGEPLDLASVTIHDFRRVLRMDVGLLERSCRFRTSGGREAAIESRRFVSMARPEIGAVEFSVTPLDGDTVVTFSPYLDGTVRNEDANYGEAFWERIDEGSGGGFYHVTMKTRKLDFRVCTGMRYELFGRPSGEVRTGADRVEHQFVGGSITVHARKGEKITIRKYVACVTNRRRPVGGILEACERLTADAAAAGFDALVEEQALAWRKRWDDCDIVIDGDVSIQQGIRFCIFQLNQTYTGDDPDLNIGPKGFTGEKYGGGTYWDTEAYCLPYYLGTADSSVARNLLLYRYRQLGGAIENAEKLGIGGGAALYPMVTMNGEECHNEWEITFEEIHRNGAIAYAIYDYVRYSGDTDYIPAYGIEVLIALSRYWVRRAGYSKARSAYVILGVTGPNEYENNVGNNWYTNTMAAWTLQYTVEQAAEIRDRNPGRFAEIVEATGLDVDTEIPRWIETALKMYFPYYPEKEVFLQQDGFLDKEIVPAESLDPEELPLHQHWSWDRILRSCFIKQADVLQGLFFLRHRYDLETIRRNFDFYEPLTVHESSLSPCVHTVLAARLGYERKAYSLFRRTARLDLDDVNNDTRDGLHITSMAGSWMAFVYGLGGMEVRDDRLEFSPLLPEGWRGYSFGVLFRGRRYRVKVDGSGKTVEMG